MMKRTVAFTVFLMVALTILSAPRRRAVAPPGEPRERVIELEPMSVARAVHSATLLDDGNVLLAGGIGGGEQTAELFDPVARAFRPAGRLNTQRAGGHTATRLLDGTVLIAGGWNGDRRTSAAEIYDPRSGRFTNIRSMNVARASHNAMLLGDGRVLISGGANESGFLDSAEIFDPSIRDFRSAPRMISRRAEFSSVRLADGAVLITGGSSGQGRVVDSAEIWDPVAGRFTAVGSMTVVRHKHASVLLPDGRALIIGGSDARDGDGKYRITEIYDPLTRSFVAGAELAAARFKIPHAVAQLGGGDVVVAGGADVVEILDASALRVRRATGSLGGNRNFTTATPLGGDIVLIAGGYDESGTTRRAWLCVRG